MIVYVAYADDAKGLPVASADTILELGKMLGVCRCSIWRALGGVAIGRTALGVPVTVSAVEISDIEEDDEDGGVWG